jgi:hypothetical protein
MVNRAGRFTTTTRSSTMLSAMGMEGYDGAVRLAFYVRGMTMPGE